MSNHTEPRAFDMSRVGEALPRIRKKKDNHGPRIPPPPNKKDWKRQRLEEKVRGYEQMSQLGDQMVALGLNETAKKGISDALPPKDKQDLPPPPSIPPLEILQQEVAREWRDTLAERKQMRQVVNAARQADQAAKQGVSVEDFRKKRLEKLENRRAARNRRRTRRIELSAMREDEAGWRRRHMMQTGHGGETSEQAVQSNPMDDVNFDDAEL